MNAKGADSCDLTRVVDDDTAICYNRAIFSDDWRNCRECDECAGPGVCLDDHSWVPILGLALPPIHLADPRVRTIPPKVARPRTAAICLNCDQHCTADHNLRVGFADALASLSVARADMHAFSLSSTWI